MNEAEKKFLEMIQQGVFSIDIEGRVWRHKVITNVGNISESTFVRRAETNLRSGYLRVRLRMNGQRFKVSAHRLIWIYFNGSIPQGLEVNHKNGVKTDNSLTNLELVTPSENSKHAFSILHNHARVGKALRILNALEVLDIKAELSSGHKRSAIAKIYGVSYDTIRSIDTGRSWAYVMERPE